MITLWKYKNKIIRVNSQDIVTSSPIDFMRRGEKLTAKIQSDLRIVGYRKQSKKVKRIPIDSF